MLDKKEIIKGVRSGDSRAENKLIEFCTDIAEAYLKTKYRQNEMLFSLISIRLRDLAIDCVAELFEKKNGNLIVLG